MEGIPSLAIEKADMREEDMSLGEGTGWGDLMQQMRSVLLSLRR